MLSYQEDTKGVLLHEGITEAGSAASWTAAGTSYATHGEPMIPIYIFYSMFGFQRTGDGLWAAADQMTRGFLLGATAGRTTLNGEGLQHEDGHSLLLASTNPACVAYDAAFAFELGHIVRDGLRRMYGEPRDGEDQNVFYYLTLYNEPITPARASRQTSTSTASSPECTATPRPRRPTGRERRSWPPASPCRGRCRRNAAARRLGRRRRRLVGDLLDRTAPRSPRRRRTGTSLHPAEDRAESRTSPAACRTHRARSWPCPTGCGPCPTRSHRSCPPPGPHWAPTASDTPTPARRCAATSTSTPSRSSSGRWPRWPTGGGSTATSSGRRWRSTRSATSGRAGRHHDQPAQPNPDLSPLDVTVVGGGVVGRSCALGLARSVAQVALVSAHPPAATPPAVAAALWFGGLAAPAVRRLHDR